MNWSNLKPHSSSLQNFRKSRKITTNSLIDNIAGMSDLTENKIKNGPLKAVFCYLSESLVHT